MSIASSIKKGRFLLSLLLLFAVIGVARSQTNRYVSTGGSDATGDGTLGNPWRTISHAIVGSAANDIINVASGIYNESVTVGKSVTIQSADSTTVISPPSGNGMNITANNVTLQNLQVRGSPSLGIIASNASNLTLTNVYCVRSTDTGVQLSNIAGVTVTGGSYSYNGKHGINTFKGSNYTMSDVRADSNGWTLNGSGITLVGITGTSQVSNLTTRYNRIHGLVIGDGATGITLNGGTFRKNGLDRGYNGGGILFYADAASDSNITIQGSVFADSNATAGIWLNAQSASYVIKNVQIGQSGTTSLVNNGGAGVIVFGNSKSITLSGTFTHGSVSSAAGVIVVGNSTQPDYAPTNVAINNCTFSAGYSSSQPVITLDDNAFHKSNQPVTAVGNTFTGATNPSAIENLIHDFLDDTTLGRVNHSNDNPLPVELVTFSAQVRGTSVTLVWSTATEVNNYGFNVERSQIGNEEFGTRNWLELGLIHGSGTSASPRSYSFTDGPVPGGQYMYRLKQIDRDGTFSFSDQVQVVVGSISVRPSLGQNFPNPFNPVTSIEFSNPTSGKTSLVVYNILGQTVSTLFDGVAEAGTHYRLQFDASGIPSGLYFYRLESGQTRIVRKMLVLK